MIPAPDLSLKYTLHVGHDKQPSHNSHSMVSGRGEEGGGGGGGGGMQSKTQKLHTPFLVVTLV